MGLFCGQDEIVHVLRARILRLESCDGVPTQTRLNALPHTCAAKRLGRQLNAFFDTWMFVCEHSWLHSGLHPWTRQWYVQSLPARKLLQDLQILAGRLPVRPSLRPPTMPGPSPHPTYGTQEISEILQFSCLFTHDIKRKKKRWQDGRLRYHTFNNRIMVYDLEGNLVDSHHRRTKEAVSEGDELNLDNGVLVQVEEQKETARQDLTELVKRRKDKEAQEIVESQARAASGMSLAQWRNRGYGTNAPRNKSIKEVLASSSKSPAARVSSIQVLPRPAANSPHITPQPARYASDTRPTKRQRVANRTESYQGRSPDLPVPSLASELSCQTNRGDGRAAIDLTGGAGIASPLRERRAPTRKNALLPSLEPSMETLEPQVEQKRTTPRNPRRTESPPHRDVKNNKRGAIEVVSKQQYQSKNLQGRLQSGSRKRNRLMCAGPASKIQETDSAYRKGHPPRISSHRSEEARQDMEPASGASLSDESEAYEF